MALTRELVTQSEGAKRLGMTPQSIGAWVKRPGAPVERTGKAIKLIWPDFALWREQERERQIREEARGSARPADLDEARARKMAAEAELAEIELARAREQYITQDEADAEAEKVFDRLRARLIAVPNKDAYRFVGLKRMPEAVKQLREVIDALLTEMSAPDFDDGLEEVA